MLWPSDIQSTAEVTDSVHAWCFYVLRKWSAVDEWKLSFLRPPPLSYTDRGFCRLAMLAMLNDLWI